RCRLSLPVDLPDRQLSAQLRHNLLLAFKEALNNIVKYADATEVRVSLEPEPRLFSLKVQDDGSGINPDTPADPDRPTAGNGMANMKERMTEIGGSCQFKSSPEEGTLIDFRVPYSAETTER
ncbi:ATP-binding protein, partial [Akkermansiaceae bacterium]|nr:ATP-binding protein [Akkermansiaceae bacterium]